MKKILLILGITLLSSILSVSAGNIQRKCGTMEVLEQMKMDDPGLESRMQQIEQHTTIYQQAGNNSQNRTASVITIPVVFHLVYNTSAQNISDAQLIAQLDQLNLDFARLNADRTNTPSAWQGISANTGIQFCLAQRDPNGNATTGIERRQTSVTSFSTNNNVKYYANGGLNAWPSSSYLNIWVCNLSGGVLGYAQFPGGSSATDGVVLLYSTVGSVAKPGTASPYNLGRTGTHEVGHWLNLYHIWGDDGTSCSGSDNVSDTPNQAGENYGCPAFPRTDGCSSSSPGVMFMNYMDYTDDRCMNMFTNGQSTRMNALFGTGGSKASLLNSLGCTPPSGTNCAIPAGLSSGNITTSSAFLSWSAAAGALSYSVQYRINGSSVWMAASSSSTSITISGLSAATTYEWQVRSNCSSSNSTYTASSLFTTTSTVSCGTAGGLSAGSITSSSAALSWTAVSGASSYNIQYRVNGTSTWTSVTSTTNSRSLTGLTATTVYQWQVQAVCSGVNGSYSSAITFTTLASTTCTDVYESNNSSSAAKTIAVNTDIIALISSSTDNDWFKFTTASPNTNIRITLTNLPKDYDIRLYNSSLSQLAISQNGGTTSETIIRNTSTAATYYVRVYGYNGAYSSTSCYTLRVSTGSTAFRTIQDIASEMPVSVPLNEMEIFPNPAREFSSIAVNSTLSGNAILRMIDITGRVTLSQDVTLIEGSNKFSLDLHKMNRGIYFVELRSGEIRIQKKIVLN
ncbi:MAG: T9SS C-terminal target domain-containing protein [Bacteroidetes bacterium]|nr:MAG: T9SS C-terminal target domain-containing protein [Bacteroidota bacterium]REK08136.1 MAG: T9SS C-terminal target domain-containing protein [Bacteroidota bacterium]REK32341.1 MAG: T9SS C-terminal target domain-containing protein [Bacteroidota bacterium]REK49575.1 MAG: T9SS C-terminal target domain-containing protein [Bacteroidota bacterium]